jgi:hypothetical protein
MSFTYIFFTWGRLSLYKNLSQGLEYAKQVPHPQTGISFFQKHEPSGAPVAHACNPSYSRRIAVRSQAGQIVPETLSRKYLTQKKGWWSGSRCRSWVQAPVPQKKRKQKQTPGTKKSSILVILFVSSKWFLLV